MVFEEFIECFWKYRRTWWIIVYIDRKDDLLVYVDEILLQIHVQIFAYLANFDL